MEVSDLWRSDGTISRTNYILWGVSLTGIKYGIDSFVAGVIFHRAWTFFNYMFPGQSLDMLAMSGPDRIFFATILLIALPFVWAGVVLTMRRLRAVAMPVFLVYLFFVPFVNIMLFVLLSAMPTIRRQSASATPGEAAAPAAITETKAATQMQPPAVLDDAPSEIPPLPKWPKPDRSLPEHQQVVVYKQAHKRADFVQAVVAVVPPAIALAWMGIFWFQSYGWGLFVGLPFAVGMSASFLYGRHDVRTFGQSVAVAMAAVTLLGISMFFFAWEGMVCLVMAAPIIYTLAFMGALIGHHMQKNKLRPVEQKIISIALLFTMPTLMGAEYSANQQPPVVALTTSIEIAAPPVVVWPHVVAVPELGPPEDFWFKVGIAYPTCATIDRPGVGAIRRCEFSTGSVVEPVTVWDPPRELAFDITAQPESMRETSWIHEIHPAHLNGYLEVRKGRFKLEEIRDQNGGMSHTRLVGTSWYSNRMWPASYWRLWSDDIIHRIHMRVLKHIKRNVEKEMRVTAS